MKGIPTSPLPTDFAIREMRKHRYLHKKAGVMLSGIESGARVQSDLYAQKDTPARENLMQALDNLNARYDSYL